jgi:parvulin-like peptidyl-prolyl isomerase
MNLSSLSRTGLVAVTFTVAGMVIAQTPAPKPGQTAPKPGAVPPVTAVPKKPPVKLPSNVVARVGGQDITRDQVLAMFDMVGGRPIVDQMVQSTIMEQEAKRLGVKVSEAEIQQAVKDAKQRLVSATMQNGTPMKFEEIAAEEGFTEDLIRWSVRLDLLRRKTFGKAVEKDIPTRDNQVKLAHILVATIPLPTSPTEQPKQLTEEERKQKEEDAKKKIDGILADIKSGKLTWEEAAKQSDDPSNKDKGGELDYYGPNMLDPAFEKAGFSIQKEGEIVGPIKSNFGWHLIKLIKRGKDLPKAEKDQYREQQLNNIINNQRALESWMAQLRAQKPVVLNRQAKIVPGAVSPARAFDPTGGKKPAPTAPVKRTSQKP